MDNMNRSTDYMLSIIRAALPYVNSKTRNGMEVAIKTGELAETFQAAEHSPELSACDLENDSTDIEGLLVSVQNVCHGPEKEMVNTVLNFIKTRKLYQSYQEFRKNNLQPELQAASMNGSSSNDSSNNNMMLNFLMSQLTPEQKSTFDAMNMILNSGNLGNLGNLNGFANFMNNNNSNNNNNQKEQK